MKKFLSESERIMKADTRDFKYNIEKMHAILKDDSPWENEKDMIKELAVDRRKRKNGKIKNI